MTWIAAFNKRIGVAVAMLIALSLVLLPSGARADSAQIKQNILAYLNGLPSRTDNRVLVGQFGSFGDEQFYATANESIDEAAQAMGGRYPAMTGMDLAAAEFNRAQWLQFVTDRWNQGMLVTLSWHAPNPLLGTTNPHTFGQHDGDCADEPGPSVDLDALTTTSTSVGQTWRAQLDTLATFFQDLENAGVVVIFRPFHEMNGCWFWWGEKDPASFSTLWQHLYTYFTTTKSLDNILWGYSPNYAWNEGAPEVDVYYPGSQYVDIVGYDIYYKCPQTVLDLDNFRNYSAFENIGKPIGIFEFGPQPSDGDNAACHPKTYDYSQIVKDIRAKYPRITFFQAWEWVFRLGYFSYSGQPDLVNDPWSVTRDELPSWSGGTSTPVPTQTSTPTPTSSAGATFYRAINLNGAAVTIDGQAWEAGTGTVPNFTTNGEPLAQPFATLIPITDAAHTAMIRSYRQHWAFNMTMSAVPAGTYQVYVYVWQDWNDPNPEAFSIAVNGQPVDTYNPGSVKGVWSRRGPFTTTISNGQIALTTADGLPNISGLEVWRLGSAAATATPTNTPTPIQTNTPTPTATPTATPGATNTFYRGINLNGPAVTIDGQAWEAGTGTVPNFTTNGEPLAEPFATLSPSTDTARASMIRSYRQHWAFNMTLSTVPNGTYQVYVYVWQDWNDPNTEAFSIALNGQQVDTYNPGSVKGVWSRRGPFTTIVSNGQIALTTANGLPNISGLEVWRVN